MGVVGRDSAEKGREAETEPGQEVSLKGAEDQGLVPGTDRQDRG